MSECAREREHHVTTRALAHKEGAEGLENDKLPQRVPLAEVYPRSRCHSGFWTPDDTAMSKKTGMAVKLGNENVILRLKKNIKMHSCRYCS